MKGLHDIESAMRKTRQDRRPTETQILFGLDCVHRERNRIIAEKVNWEHRIQRLRERLDQLGAREVVLRRELERRGRIPASPAAEDPAGSGGRGELASTLRY